MGVIIDYGCRWEESLQGVLNIIGGTEILFVDFEADYQGYLDIDVLLANGCIFSYKYSYGSCIC
jgi:hypothetical protein